VTLSKLVDYIEDQPALKDIMGMVEMDLGSAMIVTRRLYNDLHAATGGRDFIARQPRSATTRRRSTSRAGVSRVGALVRPVMIADSENFTYDLRNVGAFSEKSQDKNNNTPSPARGRVTTADRDFPLSDPAFAWWFVLRTTTRIEGRSKCLSLSCDRAR